MPTLKVVINWKKKQIECDVWVNLPFNGTILKYMLLRSVERKFSRSSFLEKNNYNAISHQRISSLKYKKNIIPSAYNFCWINSISLQKLTLE